MEEKAQIPVTEEIPPIPTRKTIISLKFALILIPVISGILFGFLYYLKLKVDSYNASLVQFQKDQINQQVNNTQWRNFEDVQMNLFLKTPSDTTLNVKDEETTARSVIVNYKGPKQVAEMKDENSLEDGYIFKVTLYTNPESINTYDLSLRKKESYKFLCAQEYSSTNVSEVLIDTAEGYQFKINNCPQYTTHTFISFNDRLYEINTSYRGDLGYRERYKQDLETIYKSISFLNKTDLDHPAGIKYTSDDGKFSLEHPLLDSKCCNIDLTIFENANKLVVMGNKESFEKSEGRDFTGIAVYQVGKTDTNFDSYIINQKNLLITDYKIITGRNPEPTEEKIMLDGVEGILLKGYAWWGDVIFIRHPQTQRILIISKLETKDNNFDTEFREILKTFKFE